MRGFTLIELLVVISIMAILTVVAIPSFNEYSRNQKLNDAASKLQSILRQAQNNAQTGTVCKLSDGSISKATYWYVDLNNEYGNGTLLFYPNCVYGAQSTQFIVLPPNVSWGGLSFKSSGSSCSPSNVKILFSNINSEVKFIDPEGGCPDTINSSLEITLSLEGSTNTKTVVVEKGGGIYVKQ